MFKSVHPTVERIWWSLVREPLANTRLEMAPLRFSAFLFAFSFVNFALPVIAAPTSSAAVTVTLDGVSYVNRVSRFRPVLPDAH